MKQCNYKVSYTTDGQKIFTSAKTGRTLTGAAKVACEKAEAERATQEQTYINNAVENAFILTWYNENADLIAEEQRTTQAECKRATEAIVHGEGFVMTNTGNVIIWPTEGGNGFTRGEMQIFINRVRARRHAITARRHANMKRSHNTAHKTTTSHAVDYTARKILGGKAMREGKRVKIVFTRNIITLRSLAWQGLPPRACGQIGVVKDGNTFKAWAFAGVVNNLPIWLVTRVYAGLNFPVVKDITRKGGDDNPPQGTTPCDDEAEYNTFCDKLDAIIHDKDNEKPKRIAITGWALTETMVRNLETACENEDVKDTLSNAFRTWTAEFARYALACLGWKYNADRGHRQNAAIEFLRKRDDEKIPIFTTARYDIISTFNALQAVTRCMRHAKENSSQAIVIRKEIRAPLARLCRKLIEALIQAQNDKAMGD